MARSAATGVGQNIRGRRRGRWKAARVEYQHLRGGTWQAENSAIGRKCTSVPPTMHRVCHIETSGRYFGGVGVGVDDKQIIVGAVRHPIYFSIGGEHSTSPLFTTTREATDKSSRIGPWVDDEHRRSS